MGMESLVIAITVSPSCDIRGALDHADLTFIATAATDAEARWEIVRQRSIVECQSLLVEGRPSCLSIRMSLLCDAEGLLDMLAIASRVSLAADSWTWRVLPGADYINVASPSARSILRMNYVHLRERLLDMTGAAQETVAAIRGGEETDHYLQRVSNKKGPAADKEHG